MKEKQILFRSFLLAGTFTFAGGIAMLPVLQKDIVDKYELMSKDEFLDYAAMAQAIPGIIGLNFAVLVGKKISGNTGMFVAAFGTVFPAFILMLLATIGFQYIPQEGPLTYAFMGIRAASASAVFMAAYSLGRHVIKSKIQFIAAILAFVAVGILSISAPYVILIAIVVAYLIYLRGEHR